MDSPSISLVNAVPQTSTAKGQVIYKEFSAPPKPLAMPGAIDIDDLVAELESQSPENAEAIAHGRKWVAETFYADRPSVAQLRLKKGWSQAELARRAETSQSYIARLEQGKIDPQISTARKIAAVLGVSIEILADALGSENVA
ncbi:MAG TPA: helix-turn-helix transcriptional regulator [Anaerolineales bacterium]|nr:helix-turn-helix transcriptional regulator [Anaerolineales bacterium]